MSASDMYNSTAPGGTWTDIQDHLPTLRELARGNVLELGVRGGVSTAALLMGLQDNGGHLWSVDVNDCSGLYRDDPHWTFLQAHSITDSARILGILPRPLSVLFIDTDHTLKTTGDELHFYAPLLRDGGVALLHDADLPGSGVRGALDEFAREIGKTPEYRAGSYGLGILKM